MMAREASDDGAADDGNAERKGCQINGMVDDDEVAGEGACNDEGDNMAKRRIVVIKA
jgi:hypothetical protein